jgi:uncharacterized protein (DUF433 family)
VGKAMSDVISINYIERKPDSEKYRIIGKGITVEYLSRLIDDPEWPVARICEAYGLTPSEVYAAWSFYYDHKAEIDENVRRNDEAIEVLPSIREHLERKRREKDRRPLSGGKN